LVELHGGSVNLESEVNKGTTVSILLPASRNMETAGGQCGPMAAE
jgi:signal transduction histidine kinase